MTDHDDGVRRCPALFDPFDRNIRPAPAVANAITVRCERPDGHVQDKSLGWERFVHQSEGRRWNTKRGINFRYYPCGEVAVENGRGRCVKYTAHTYGPPSNRHHETAEGLRWGGLVFIGPDPMSRAPKGVEPDRCERVFAGRRCRKPRKHDPEVDKRAFEHPVGGGEIWVVEYGRGTRTKRSAQSASDVER